MKSWCNVFTRVYNILRYIYDHLLRKYHKLIMLVTDIDTNEICFYSRIMNTHLNAPTITVLNNNCVCVCCSDLNVKRLRRL